MRYRILILLANLFLLNILAVQAQQKQRFQVTSFKQDPLDLSARNEEFKKIDSNGSLYAIIKVKSDLEDDDLMSYHFDFGLMNNFTVMHDDLQELWLYVQKNAKTVTISRDGYLTLSKYDLRTTIEAGSTYLMSLSVSGPVVYNQMIVFQVTPSDSKAVVTVKSEEASSSEQMLGMIDETGAVAKGLPYGTYTYRVMAENYHSSEGRFTLNNQLENHIEQVTLRPNFATVTLSVDADADIYVDGRQCGNRSWTGPLSFGSHQVECRQANHNSTSQSIWVKENAKSSFTLKVPTPIIGALSVTTRPLGASISIDGEQYGLTPQIIPNLLIGQHVIDLAKDGYKSEQQIVDIQQNKTIGIELNLTKGTDEIVKSEITNNVPVIKEKTKSDSWGIRFGVGGSSIVGGATSDGMKNLLVGYLGVDYSNNVLFKNFYFIPSAGFIVKGGRYYESGSSYYFDFKYYYIDTQLSLFGAYAFHPSWKIKVGPYVSYAISGKCLADYSVEVDSGSRSDDIFSDGLSNRFDAGVVAGIDFCGLRNFVFGIEYQRGFVPTYEKGDMYISAFYASIGYRF